MSYVYMSDLTLADVQRVPTVADKVAITALVKQVENAQTVTAAWQGYQEVINRMKTLQGWADSCSGGFFSSCPGGDFGSFAELNARLGEVIGGFTQSMSFSALSEMLTAVQREIAAVRPGSKWDPTDSAVARKLVSILSPGAGIIMYFTKPQTASESVGQVQKAYLMWQQLSVIARDSGRITTAQYADLRTRADPAFRALGTTVVAANASGSALDNALTAPPTLSDAAKFLECLYNANGPVDAWNCLPTWGKFAVGVVGVGVVVVPALYVVTIFAPLLRAGGNVAERLTRKNAPGACDRCGSQTISSTMSRFNTEMICPSCERREKAHPRYAEARDAELKQVQAGNYNFPGIGKPKDI